MATHGPASLSQCEARVQASELEHASALDIFTAKNLKDVMSRIDSLCDEDAKAGAKMAFGNLLRKCCKILKAEFTKIEDKEHQSRIQKFQDIITETHKYSRYFSAVEYKLKEAM